MKKLLLSIMVILLSIMCITNYSFAAGVQLEATIDITPDKVETSEGDVIKFTITTKDIKNAETGKIYAIEGVIEYDSNFFEVDTTTSTLEVGETGKFNSMTPVSEGGTNGIIALKIKDSATGSSVVKFTGLAASDGRMEDSETQRNTKTPDTEITVTIKEDQTENPGDGDDTQDPSENPGGGDDTQDPSENPGDGDDTQNPSENPGDGDDTQDPSENPGDGDDTQDPSENPGDGNDTQNPTEEPDDTVSDKNLPAAGINTVLAVSIVLIAVFGFVVYRKSKKYQDIK